MLALLDRLSVRSRFLLLGAMGLVLAIIPAAMYLLSTWETLDATRREADGIVPARAL